MFFVLATLLGVLPMAKIDGVTYSQSTALANYFSKVGSMAKLSPLEELRSNMMLQTVTDVFVDGIAIPAFRAMNAKTDLGKTLRK